MCHSYLSLNCFLRTSIVCFFYLISPFASLVGLGKMSYSRCLGILIPLATIIITLLLTYVIAPHVLWAVVFHDEDVTYDFPSYKHCARAPSICGNSTIRYPFGICGIFSVHCMDNHTIILSDQYGGGLYRVMGDITESSYSTTTLQLAQDILEFPFSSLIWMFNSIFSLSNEYTEGIVYNCTQRPRDIPTNMAWLDWGETNGHYLFYNGTYYSSVISGCTWYSYIVVPADKKYNISGDKNFEQLQRTGFQITWELSTVQYCISCEGSGGRCYSPYYSTYDIYFSVSFYADVYCLCRNGDVHNWNCTDGEDPVGRITTTGVMAGIFLGGCGLFSIVVVFCIVVRRQGCCCKKTDSEEEQSIRAFMDPLDSRPPSVENFLNYYSSQSPTRYSYTQIMIYTKDLKDRIGKGGFGTVYKGKLPNGHLIAVKILDESKQSEQQFIAEVATVGMTCHVNLVRLLGYCSQPSRRALVYEYMVNGSLEKYIHGDHEDELDWKQLFSIALGTARGIAYLHDECRNRILHFDIKPHNVLLDANFLPKVADFGLAKISDREESHISVANRGTLGYAAPEMWSEMYGPVTDRSDVYSYGMLVMEMVGGRKNIDFENKESRSSRFFYTEWAFKQVQKGEFGNLRKENMSEEEQSIAKKLSLVGLWCIQFIASQRPSMSKVIQMLEGGIDIISPPFPFPVDPHPPSQPYASGESSSNYALEIQMTNPINIETDVIQNLT